MANPTTNYGWVLPTPTDLVTDLPADFDVALQGVDNTMATMVPKTIVDAKGDLIAGTAADTVARIGIGADNTVLTADSTTATGMKWEVVSAGATINYQAFTSSTTWTVPTSAKYVDVMVVGGGLGGKGGRRANAASGTPGFGGAITMMNNIFLNGTGTVSIVVGAGSSGTAGTSTTSDSAEPSSAGYSGFGSFCYSQGAISNQSLGGWPGYKGTNGGGTASINLVNDSNQSNFAPILFTTSNVFYSPFTGQAIDPGQLTGLNSYGLQGGRAGYASSGTGFRSGLPAGSSSGNDFSSNVTTMTLPSSISSEYNTAIGAATAGTDGNGRTGSGGAAGIAGFSGGGGSCVPSTSGVGAQGGHGAGGGGSWPSTTNNNGGNGGNAGTNTGAGGGGGACTGSTAGGTGGTGGNGAAGIVIVKWIS